MSSRLLFPDAAPAMLARLLLVHLLLFLPSSASPAAHHRQCRSRRALHEPLFPLESAPALPSPPPAKFLPVLPIRTAAVNVADDNVLPDAVALSFAFAAWQQQAARSGGALVGFSPRSHHLDLARGRWAYTAAEPGRYSMVLTKLMVCEDVLMHFVFAEESGQGPVLSPPERGGRVEPRTHGRRIAIKYGGPVSDGEWICMGQKDKEARKKISPPKFTG